jgi:hypothetical protein
MNGKCYGFDADFVEGQNPKINLQNVWRTSRSFGFRSKTDGNIPQYSALSTPKITTSSIFLKIFSNGLKMAKLRKMRFDKRCFLQFFFLLTDNFRRIKWSVSRRWVVKFCGKIFVEN